MVKAILLDFWGTLVENGVSSPIKQVREILGLGVPFSEYVVRMERAMMTQPFPNLREAFENVCREFHLEVQEEKIEQLIGLWNKSWMLAQPYPEIIEALGKLQEDYVLVLISNTDNFSIDNVLKKFRLETFFDRKFLSYQVGRIKTDPLFLKEVLGWLELKIDDCVLVGDSLESDIMAAKSLGMKAVLVDRKNRRTFEPKITDLNQLKSVL